MFSEAGCSWILLLAVLLSGCGDAPETFRDGDTRGFVPSIELRQPLADSRDALRNPPVRTVDTGNLQAYDDLSTRIWRPDERKGVAREILARWQRDPEGVLWVEMARDARSRGFLGESEVADSLLALPALSDTSTARGCLLQAILARRRTIRLTLLEQAEAQSSGLTLLEQVWLQRGLAAIQSRQGCHLAAVDRLIGWLPAVRTAGGSALEYFLWNDIARDLRRAGRLGDALQAVRMARDLADHAGSTFRSLQARRRIAFILGHMGETITALEVYDACLAEALGRDHPAVSIRVLNQVGALEARRGNYDAALEAHKRNLVLNLAVGDTVNAIRNMCNTSYSYRMLDRMDSCAVYQVRTEKWLKRWGSARLTRELTPWLAEYYFHVGDYVAVDSLLADASTSSSGDEAAGKRAKLLLTMLRQGLESARPDLAYWALEEMDGIRNRLFDVSSDYSLLADLEITSADFLALQGEYLQAAAALARARDIVDRQGGEYASWDLERSTFELAMFGDDHTAAAAAADRCLDIATGRDDPDLILTSRELRGRCALAQSDFETARAFFSPVEQDSSFGGNYRARLATLINLGTVRSRQGEPEAAMELFENAAHLYTQSPPDDLAVRLELERGRMHRAASEHRAAEQAFLRALERLSPVDPSGPMAELRRFHDGARRAITEELIDLYLECPRLSGRIPPAVRTLQLAEACRRQRSSSLAEEVPFPEAGRPLLVFFVGRHHSFSWTVDDGACTVRELPGRRSLEGRIAPVLADLSTPGGPVGELPLAVLSDLLLAKIFAVWTPGETLVVVPDDILFSVPWYALRLPSSVDGGSARDLLQYGPLVIATSPGEDPNHADRSTRPASGRPHGDLLAVGVDGSATTGFGSRLASLRHAEAEARAVANLWRVGEGISRTGSAASWTRISDAGLEGYRVIHFATHIVAHQGQADRATLRLAAAEGSQPLTLQTVRNLEIEADLIYLSCCEAAHRLQDGGGVYSFAHAFLAAGARSVIAPTIRVDDEASLFLATRFYLHWQDGNNRATALRAALLDLRAEKERWAHPFFWGFHNLIGEG